jgi:hypothetical protein
MDIYSKKIRNILEYVLIFVVFFMGIRKGGYYKEDSLVLVYVVQLIAILYYIFSFRKIKINKTIGISLIGLVVSYFIPILIRNTATVSGALNIAIRIYSMFLVYLIVFNSENKEKYIKAVILFTIICGILALDEMTIKLLDKPLKLLGGGYLSDNNGRVGSIFQYSNLLGILSLISLIYVLYSTLKEDKCSNLKKIVQYLQINFFSIIILITQSKMVLLLYIIYTIAICAITKKYKEIVKIIGILIYSLLSVSIATKTNALYIILAILLFGVYCVFNNIIKKKIYNNIFKIITILILGIVIVIYRNYILDSGIINSIKEYFSNYYSTKLRITYYEDAIKLIIKTPLNFIFGMGGNSFRTMYETVQTLSYISLETHSFIIQIFLESGVLGLICIVTSIIYLIKSKGNLIYKLLLSAVVIFAAFDVFLTYTFMLYILAIIMGMFNINAKDITIKFKVANLVLYISLFVLTSIEVIAFFVEPLVVNDINNSLEKQEKVISSCELALKLDPYDLEYMRNYTSSLVAYIDILEIKEEIYGIDYSNEKNEVINKIYKNVNNETKYEKDNKYAIEDNVYYVYKYVDELVQYNYNDNIQKGYEIYLDEMLEKIEKLRQNHANNSYAISVYSSSLTKIYTKYYYVNNIINSDKVQNILDTLKENEYISL